MTTRTHSKTGLKIGGVSERDLDLFLLEEFVASSEFAHWFCATSNYTAALYGTVTSADRSVTNSTGESDLEIDIQDNIGTTHRLLIENKINAGFQPEQASRYRDRGNGYLRQKDIASYRTILVAPKAYFAGDPKGFDARIDYEQILEWSEQKAEPRFQYKIALLKGAIEKSTSGYQAVEDQVVSTFWRDYWHRTHELAPELDMPEPGMRPGRSSFVQFRTPRLPKHIVLVHKLAHGNVDLEMRGCADQIPTIRRMLGDELLPGMNLIRASKSAVLRMEVPKLALNDSATHQRIEIKQGIDTVEHVRKWAHESALHNLNEIEGLCDKHNPGVQG